MNKFQSILLGAACALAIAGCTISDEKAAETENEQSDLRVKPLQPEAGTSPQTPADERIANVLWEAKMQYDDGHYDSSFRFAEQAVTLIDENNYPKAERSLAFTIQGFCLLQLGKIENYHIKSHGTFDGALTKFNTARELNPDDHRPLLGRGLALFRLHADKIRKAEVMLEGIQSIQAMCEELKAAGNTEGKDAAKLILSARKRLGEFSANRTKLLGYHYIFKDLSLAVANDRQTELAPWIPLTAGNMGLTEGQEALKLQDVTFTLEDALQAKAIDADTVSVVERDLKAVAANWEIVRKYWLLSGLKDLQDSRNLLLEVRNKAPGYLWVERDLVFVYQSLGAFFLDLAMQRAWGQAAADGVPVADRPAAARRIYLSKEFQCDEKRESRENYNVALEFTKSFVKRHKQEIEEKREEKRDAQSFTDSQTDPFTTDLFLRYRATMDSLITEERNVRFLMMIEAAALCIDPLFQVGSLREAESWATQLKANSPENPIHHFVRATAYYQDGQFKKAKEEYDAFLRGSSVAQDKNRRDLARQRRNECEGQLLRAGAAGEDTGK